jgi:hypothetical protein
MGSPRITYAHYPYDTISESDVRARAWAYVFDCYRKKKATPASSPDAVKDQDPMHPSKTRGEVAM